MMMPFSLLFFVVFIIIGLILIANYVAVSRQERNNPKPEQIMTDWEAINDEVVQAEITTGNKIGAIKRYRLLTGQGLKESKDAIDYAMLHPDEHSAKKKKATYDAQDAGVRDLILEGRLDEAVEIYQKFAGVDAYTARDAVDEIARDLHLSDQSDSHITFDAPPAHKSSATKP